MAESAPRHIASHPDHDNEQEDDDMDVDDFNQLADFVFDQSTPESGDDEAQETRPETNGGVTASGTHDVAPNGRVIRRRARKACVACHKRYVEFDISKVELTIRRKVRCDVMSRGNTCTNCRLDGITCVIRAGFVSRMIYCHETRTNLYFEQEESASEAFRGS